VNFREDFETLLMD